MKNKTDDGFDKILLHAKFFVYKCRIDKIIPNIQGFINQLKHIYKIDKYAHYLEMKTSIFAKTWLLYNNLIN